MNQPRSTKLRSRDWFGKDDRWGLAHRAWLRAEGFSERVFEGKPVIGICNSWSELNNCNAHLRQVAEAVKRGVWEAGGFPLEFCTISLGEMLMKPTTMLYRNLMAMDVEECIRAYPLDGVVLLCGCDKTTPAQLMGAASADVPALMVPGGPMLRGMWHGTELGSGTDVRRFWEEVRAGPVERRGVVRNRELRLAQRRPLHGDGHRLDDGRRRRSPGDDLAGRGGHTRGGLAPPLHCRAERAARRGDGGGGPSPLPHSDRRRARERHCVLMALGGSTNAIIHLVAIAGRLGLDPSPFEVRGDLPHHACAWRT